MKREEKSISIEPNVQHFPFLGAGRVQFVCFLLALAMETLLRTKPLSAFHGDKLSLLYAVSHANFKTSR